MKRTALTVMFVTFTETQQVKEKLLVPLEIPFLIGGEVGLCAAAIHDFETFSSGLHVEEKAYVHSEPIQQIFKFMGFRLRHDFPSLRRMVLAAAAVLRRKNMHGSRGGS